MVQSCADHRSPIGLYGPKISAIVRPRREPQNIHCTPEIGTQRWRSQLRLLASMKRLLITALQLQSALKEHEKKRSSAVSRDLSASKLQGGPESRLSNRTGTCSFVSIRSQRCRPPLTSNNDQAFVQNLRAVKMFTVRIACFNDRRGAGEGSRLTLKEYERRKVSKPTKEKREHRWLHYHREVIEVQGGQQHQHTAKANVSNLTALPAPIHNQH